MKQTGYVIARSARRGEFFVSSSSYDRPRWVPLTEATVYHTADAADRALGKLLRNGSYESRLVDLTELTQFTMPNGETITPGEREQEDQMPTQDVPGDTELPVDDDQGMVADKQQDVCPECGHEPCTCEHHAGDEEEEENAQPHSSLTKGQLVTFKGEKYRVATDDGSGTVVVVNTTNDNDVQRVSAVDLLPVTESATMPAKPAADATSAATVSPKFKVDTIKFHNDLRNTVQEYQPGDADQASRIQTPANVMADLDKAIAEFSADAEKYNGLDDARASFCMTTAEAFKQLRADLALGTVDGVKMAQVHMTSWMSPITNNVPNSVQKFVYMGGRKPSLRDIFTDKLGKKE